MPITLLISRSFCVKPQADVHLYSCRDTDRPSHFWSIENIKNLKFLGRVFLRWGASVLLNSCLLSRGRGHWPSRRGRRRHFITFFETKTKKRLGVLVLKPLLLIWIDLIKIFLMRVVVINLTGLT